MILTERITALETQLATAQQQAQKNFADFTAASDQIKRCRALFHADSGEPDEEEDPEGDKDKPEDGGTKKASLEVLVTTALGDRKQLRADLETAKTQLAAEQASRETAIAAEVTKRIAASGGDPIKRDPAATAPGEPAATGGDPRQRLAATITVA